MSPFIVILLSSITVTSYQPIRSQTDDSPTITSIGVRVNKHGVAVSRDLLCPMALCKDLRIKRHSSSVCRLRRIHYNDAIYIEGYGWKIVNDCMNKRHKRAVDILVFSKEEEHKIGTRHGLKVWVVQHEKEKASSR